MVVFENVVKTYPGTLERRAVHAVKGISFSLNEGEVVAFVGPNGAGKTTTLNILLGLLRPTSGRVTIRGRPPTDPSTRAAVGYLPERPYFYEHLTANEFLTLCGSLSGMPRALIKERAGALLARVGLDGVGNRKLRHFSRGMLQRVGLAQALIHDPALLVLDEPMLGLDPLGRSLVRELISEAKARGVTVIYSSHILADAELIADRVAVIVEGRLRALAPLVTLRESQEDRLELTLAPSHKVSLEQIAQRWPEGRLVGNAWVLTVSEEELQKVVAQAIAREARVVEVRRLQAPLEEVLVRLMTAQEEAK